MTIPASRPTTNKPVETSNIQRLHRCSHSKLGRRKPGRGGSLCFNRYDWAKYISPAANPSETATVPNNCANP